MGFNMGNFCIYSRLEEFKVYDVFIIGNVSLNSYFLIILCIYCIQGSLGCIFVINVLRYVFLGIYDMLLRKMGFYGLKLVGISFGIFIYVLFGNYLGMVCCSAVLTSECLNNFVLSSSV